MTYFHLVIQNYFKNTDNLMMIDNEDFINKKAESALREFEQLRLSGADVNTAHEITTSNLLENLAQMAN